jgi:hypothetical protein
MRNLSYPNNHKIVIKAKIKFCPKIELPKVMDEEGYENKGIMVVRIMKFYLRS